MNMIPIARSKNLARAWLIFFAAVAFCFLKAEARADETLLVSAAASLKPVLDEISKLPHQPHVSINFGGSGALAQQIENGAPVDVFISASPVQMDALEAAGFLATGTRRILLKNELVLIAPQKNERVSSFADLAKPDVKIIAMGEPKSVPVGTYAQEVFTHLHLMEAIKSKVVFLLDARQVLAAVERGDADAGVVYVSDAQSSRAVRMIERASEDSHSPIVYPVAVLKNSVHPGEAMEFVARLFSPEAAEVFRRGGFVVAP